MTPIRSSLRAASAVAGLVICAALATRLLAAAPAANVPAVDMVLLAEQTPQTATTGRKWADLLTAVGVGNIQIRAGQPGDKLVIEPRGSKDAPSYHVVGKLDGTNLKLPGGQQFTLSDRAKLSKWLAELGENGAAGVTEKKTTFGLLPRQLADVRDDLAQPISFQTKGMAGPQAIEKIRSQLKTKLVLDEAAEKALAADDPIRDELNGYSCGTVIAAIARPAGAMLVPRKPHGGEVECALVKAVEGAEAWPIGWPPEHGDAKALPQLLDSFNTVEIRETPASQAIEAIQARMKVPFLYDYNSIVKNRIDMAKAVTIPPAKKALYASVLRQVLFKAGLKYVVRVDEADKPLIWITTLK